MNETDLLILAAEIEHNDTQARERAHSESAERETLEYVRTWARESAWTHGMLRDAYLTT